VQRHVRAEWNGNNPDVVVTTNRHDIIERRMNVAFHPEPGLFEAFRVEIDPERLFNTPRWKSS